MFYDRKIKYLDYFENGERIRGGGYVKMQVRNGCLQMDLAVTGLYPTDAFDREVILCGDKKEKSVGKILICDGKGTFRHMCHDVDNIGNTGISYNELYGIRIPLATGREISCIWREANAVPPEERKELAGAEVLPEYTAEKAREERTRERRARGVGEERPRKEREKEEGTTEERAREGVRKERTREGRGREEGAREEMVKEGRTREEGGKEDSARAGMAREGRRREEEGKEERARERRTREESAEYGKETDEIGSAGKRQEKPVQLMEDKWQQIYAIYPHIRPFEDEREYISIRPADFVLFPAESYRMVNNSFLLHGYYNYKHLLLAKVERKGEVYYYIGVPGNYYEKEKQVAIMFGFESFECAEEPAQAGDFGYYMMRTEL